MLALPENLPRRLGSPSRPLGPRPRTFQNWTPPLFRRAVDRCFPLTWGNEKRGRTESLPIAARPPKPKMRSPSYDNRTRNQGPHAKNRIGRADLPRRGMSPLCRSRDLPAPSAPPTFFSPRRRALRPCLSFLDFAIQVPELPPDVYRLSALSLCDANNLSVPCCSSGPRTF